jgi:GNAT superfamily N-acetyltransferase
MMGYKFMDKLVKELSRYEKPALETHFLALARDDRRLRFGTELNDFAIRAYVMGIDFGRDAVFGVLDDELRIIGAAHLAHGADYAELGVSVLGTHRHLGIGGELLRRAHIHARNWGVRGLFMHCLTENSVMMHLARKQGMDIVADSGESEAWLRLPLGDAVSRAREDSEQCIALVDYRLKSERVRVLQNDYDPQLATTL